MAELPEFDPSRPSEPDLPEFDPGKPFEAADAHAPALSGTALDAAKASPSIGAIMGAFGEGFREGWGPDRLGMSDESKRWLADKNILPRSKEDYRDPFKPFMAFNEGIILPLAATIDAGIRAASGAFRGAQAAVAETGQQFGFPKLGRELAAMPEAFFGTPHPTGMPRSLTVQAARAESLGMTLGDYLKEIKSPAAPKPFVEPVPIRPISINLPRAGHVEFEVGKPRSELAKTGDPLIDAILDHPTLREVINNPVVDDTHTIPNSLGDSRPTENPTLYRDKDFPKQLTVDGVTFDTAEPAAVHENVEGFVIDVLTKAGMDQATALKVAFWNFGEVAEDAWYRSHGIDPAKIDEMYQEHLDRIASRGVEPEGVLGPAIKVGDPWTPEMEAQYKDWRRGGAAGPEDNRTLWADQFEARLKRDIGGVPSDLFRGTYPDGDPAKAGPGPVDKPTPEEVARARDIVGRHMDGLAESAPDPASKLAQARDLGVIGPEKPPITEGTPAEAAARTIEASRAPDEKITQEVAGGNPWRDRFEKFVGKLDTGEDVKQLIREAADQNGEFLPARQGNIPLSHVEDVARSAGVEPGEINQRGLGRTLKNDAEVRVAMQLMLQATENVKNAAREVRADGSEANLIALQESIMRRDLAVEQVVGLRAEWGRTGNVIQEFQKAAKEEAGLTNFLKDKGKSPQDLKNLADAIDGLDGAQAARFMNDARTPTKWDKLMWYWVNALISGPVTHAKYVVANATFATYESAVVTPIAGAIGTVRRALASVPDVPDGHTRLFRVEPLKASEIAKVPDWLKESSQYQNMMKARGRWFAADQDNVTWYKQHLKNDGIEPKVTYIDVPNDKVEQHRVSNLNDAEVKEFSRRPEEEFFVPQELAAQRKDLVAKREGVFIGEAAARIWGLVAGTPDAIVAAARAAKTGLQTPLPGEVAQNIIPKQNRAVSFQQKPIDGTLGTLIGIPSRGASGIHSFFNFLGYRASMEAQAYRAAAKEGLRPNDDAFWQRRQAAVDSPTKKMMDAGIEEGYRLTYISELSPAAKLISQGIKATKVGQLLLPFTHIPFNILSRGLEGTPAAFLTSESRADLFGKNGPVKQDMATARLVAGSALGVWAVNLVASDRMTGYGPTDPKERAQWLATGHQPYSIRIGDYWYSFNRFGSIGTMLGLHANLAEAIPHLKPDSEELTKALVMTVHSSGRLLEDEVGMQGLAGLIEAINEPERKGTRFVSNFAGSFLPYSSALRQTASAMDPEMRETKSVVDGLRYYIPAVRHGLNPKRDWLGMPITNAGYGGDISGAPGLSAIIQHRQANADPISLEMQAVDLHPAPPQDRIGGVKLPPKLYDLYQATAGPFTRQALEPLINQPGWHEMPVSVREEVMKRTIEATRKAAGAAIQAAHPEIIQQGIQQRLDHINGVKPTKLKD